MPQGAPVGFSGPVFPNPKGIKPTLDTDAKPRADEPVGGKMSVDNAPIYAHPIEEAAKPSGPRHPLGKGVPKNHPAVTIPTESDN
jgi:hypothetical protein